MPDKKEHDRSKITFDVDETADMLKVHRNTVLQLAEKGKLPGAKIGRAWVFVVDDLVKWLRLEVERQRHQRLDSKTQLRTGGGRRRPPPTLPNLPET
ncbi:MAG: helix-turn-helix domain-containing protein [Acidihalobacter sp.]|uniref:helix-turn-helix domain-containing protein n=1 Tax=Acidihalobacter sp. TaxID=1872108 RepID=UPI00307CD642